MYACNECADMGFVPTEQRTAEPCPKCQIPYVAPIKIRVAKVSCPMCGEPLKDRTDVAECSEPKCGFKVVVV